MRLLGMRPLVLISFLAFLVAACPDDPVAPREVARVRAHLERVEQELEATFPAGLTTTQVAKRASVIQNLRRYIEAERYPTNRTSHDWTPIFVDDDGARCAVAALVEASGHPEIVERIARDHNLAYVQELRDDPALGAWLTEHGVSLDEAARIQPDYANTTGARWQPTGSIIGSIQGSGGDGTGAHAVVSPGIRLGARRVTKSNSSCDECVHTSLALVAEYSRLIAGGSDHNQVALLLLWDLTTESGDYQYYLIGGPVAVLADDTVPGVQAGAGFSLRGRGFPLLTELTFSALDQGGDTIFRGAANIGVVW